MRCDRFTIEPDLQGAEQGERELWHAPIIRGIRGVNQWALYDFLTPVQYAGGNGEHRKGPMPDEESDYASYLLRLWRAEEGGRRVWRASLERVHGGEQRSFASLQALIAYLEARFAPGCEGEDELRA